MDIVVINKSGGCKLVSPEYELLKEEEFTKISPFECVGKYKPVYDYKTKTIIESATDEEIENIRYPNGKPEPVTSTKTNAELEEELTLTQMAVAEGYEENLLLKEELKKNNALLDVASGAIVDIYETILLGGE